MARFQGRMTPQAVHSLELQFGISHDPLWMQYFQYLNNLFHGNMGTSFTYFPTPVSTVLLQELPWTLALVGTSVLIRSEEHTSELQSHLNLVCRLLLEKKEKKTENVW